MANFISHKWEGLQAAFDMVDSNKAKQGLKRGMKKVGDGTKTVASKAIRDAYDMKKGDVDRTFSVYAADQSLIITSKGRPINLTYFNTRQFGSRGGKRVTTRRVGDTIQSKTRGRAGSFGGVAAIIRKGSTTLLPGAFLAKVRAGNKGKSNIGVFIRASHQQKSAYSNPYKRKTNRPYNKVNRAATAYRQAIINKAMVAVPTLFTAPQVMDKVFAYVKADGLKTLMHEILWATAGKR